MAAPQKVVLPLQRHLEVTEGHGVLRDEQFPESHAPGGRHRQEHCSGLEEKRLSTITLFKTIL